MVRSKLDCRVDGDSSEAQGTCPPAEEVLVAVRLVIRIMQKNMRCELRKELA